MRRQIARIRPASTVLLAVGVGWPIVALGRRAAAPLAGRDGLGWSTVGSVLGDQRTWRLTGQTIAQAAASTAVAVVVGAGLAALVSGGGVAGGRRVLDLALLTFVMPTLVMGSAVRELAGWMGVAEHRWAQIVVAHALFNIGFVATALAPAIASVSASIDESARMLGRSRRAAAATVMRVVSPAVAQAAGIVFVLCVTSFGVILVLGGVGARTLEVEIWIEATRLVDLPVACVLSLLQLTTVLMGLLAIRRVGSRSGAPAMVRRSTVRIRFAPTLLAWSVAFGVVAVPLAGLVRAAAWTGGSWSANGFRSLREAVAGSAVTPLAAVARSSALALVVAAAAVVVGLIIVAEGGRTWRRQIAVAPLAASAATVGLAYLMAWSGPVDLRGTWLLVVAVQVAVVSPIALAVLGPAVDAASPSRRAAAAVLGATRRRRLLEIWWPALRGSTFVAAGLCSAAALGEIGATTMVAGGDLATAPVVMQRLLSRPGPASASTAAALGVVLIVVAATIVSLARGLGRRSGRGAGLLSIGR